MLDVCMRVKDTSTWEKVLFCVQLKKIQSYLNTSLILQLCKDNVNNCRIFFITKFFTKHFSIFFRIYQTKTVKKSLKKQTASPVFIPHLIDGFWWLIFAFFWKTNILKTKWNIKAFIYISSLNVYWMYGPMLYCTFSPSWRAGITILNYSTMSSFANLTVGFVSVSIIFTSKSETVCLYLFFSNTEWLLQFLSYCFACEIFYMWDV